MTTAESTASTTSRKSTGSTKSTESTGTAGRGRSRRVPRSGLLRRKAGDRPEPLGPRFAHLLGATGASNLADGILLVGVPLLALTLTQSPQLIALVPAALTLPWLLLSVPVGIAADRYDRVRMLAFATALRVVVLVGAAVAGVAGQLSIPVLLGLLVLLGSAEVVADSAAGTLIPATVARHRLPSANSRLLSLQQLMNSFLGGPVAGLVVALGAGWLFGVPAALCAAALVLVLRGLWGKVPRQPQGATPSSSSSATATSAASTPAGARRRGRVRAELAEGLDFLRGNRVVRSNIVVGTVLNFASTGYFAVLVLWVVGPASAVGLPPEAYGLLTAAVAVGALTGAAVTGRVLRVASEAQVLGTAWLANAALLALPVLVPHWAALAVAAFLLGVTNMAGNVVGSSVRQRLIPDGVRGRVGGVARMAAYGSMPLGAVVAGFVGERVGLPAVFWGATALGVVVVLWWILTVPQRVIDEADAAEVARVEVADAAARAHEDERDR